MNKTLSLLLLIFLVELAVFAQVRYKDFIVTDKAIWALSERGELDVFDVKSGKSIKRNTGGYSEIKDITTDIQGRLVITDKNGWVKSFNGQTQTWIDIVRLKEINYGILFDSKNRCYAITNKGIIDVGNDRIYFSGSSLNDQIRPKEFWEKPYCYYIDKKDRIWIGYGYGEWGGNLYVFETTSKNFLTSTLNTFQISLWPVRSFFEDSSSVYLSAGLQHMFTKGTIIGFKNLKAFTLLESTIHEGEPDDKGMRKMLNGEYIGPATFNKFTNSIYFYSQNGMFKGNTSRDLSKVENWELIVKPQLQWENGQPDAVGSPMNVLKITILDKDRFAFLSQNDGIGLYDGNKVIMLK
ncbi:hypothetical protein WG906_08640 [Pedobacter sp. P351]|uniref:hypothetical protein n=1 Tax=Pedobacter superstes TaxID=3133441 RepID=UPI0030957E68